MNISPSVLTLQEERDNSESMFLKKKKNRGRVYGGDIVVVPRSGLKKLFSNLSPPLEHQGEAAVEKFLRQLVDLPPQSSRNPRHATDMALDIIVPEHDYGEFMLYGVGNYGIPFIWRPGITITGRLYVIDSRETVFSATVKHTLSWSSWAKRVSSFSKFMRIRANMSDADIEHFVTEAVVKLLSKVLKNS